MCKFELGVNHAVLAFNITELLTDIKQGKGLDQAYIEKRLRKAIEFLETTEVESSSFYAVEIFPEYHNFKVTADVLLEIDSEKYQLDTISVGYDKAKDILIRFKVKLENIIILSKNDELGSIPHVDLVEMTEFFLKLATAEQKKLKPPGCFG